MKYYPFQVRTTGLNNAISPNLSSRCTSPKAHRCRTPQTHLHRRHRTPARCKFTPQVIMWLRAMSLGVVRLIRFAYSRPTSTHRIGVAPPSCESTLPIRRCRCSVLHSHKQTLYNSFINYCCELIKERGTRRYLCDHSHYTIYCIFAFIYC